jgi:hypothetical protein
LNQRINDCASNLLPSLAINFEEQRRLDTEALKNQIDYVADDVVNQLIQLNMKGDSSKMMELLTDIKANSDDMKTEIMGQILELEKKLSSSKPLTLRDFVGLEDLFCREKESLKAFLDDKLAEYNHHIQTGLRQIQDNIGANFGVLFKILNEIHLTRDEKQERQELLKRVVIPSSSRVEVKETSVLGMGGFGTVYLGYYDTAKVAIKSLHSANGSEMEAVENEVLLMNYLGSHPHILTCYGIWKDARGLTSIVLDYSPYGSLVDILYNFDAFPELPVRLQLGWAVDLVNALYFIHSKNVKHRDVKADNLLVFSELKVKLCDFGLSKQQSQSMKPSLLGGTEGFMAPELFTGKGSGLSSDVFSWAMAFYQIVMRKRPQVALSHSRLMGNLLVELGDKLDGVDVGPLASLLTDCIHESPESRPLAGGVNGFMLGVLGHAGGDPRLGVQSGDDEIIHDLEGRLKAVRKNGLPPPLKKAQEAVAEVAKFTGVCEKTLEGHSDHLEGHLHCLIQLADGRVVSGSRDQTLKVWNVNTGYCERTLYGHSECVRCVVQLADGRVVSGSGDNTLKVWNVNTGVCERTLEGHSEWVECLIQLADGRVVSGDGDCKLKVWNVNTGVCERTLEGHSEWVYCLVLLADGRVMSGSDDHTLKVWNVNTGVCEKTLEGHNGGIHCLVQLADGRVVSGGGLTVMDDDDGFYLKVWNVNTGVCKNISETLEGHGECVYCVVQLADGRVVSGSGDNTLHVWNVNTGEIEQTLEGHTASVICLVQLADGRVVSGDGDGKLMVWK